MSHTAVNGAVDVDLYVNGTGTYMIGNVAAMCGELFFIFIIIHVFAISFPIHSFYVYTIRYYVSGTCVWVISATCAGLPISATHSLVGGTVGFTLVVHGGSGVNWASVAMTRESFCIHIRHPCD